MKHFNISILVKVLMVTLMVFFSSCNSKDTNNIPKERVKVALREVGNQLLLSKNDSVSLVLPVTQISKSTFEITFENTLEFDPAVLNKSIEKTFKKANLPENYIVEVVQCNDAAVAYSYEMFKTVENNIVPCGGRIMPKKCYIIQLSFTEVAQTTRNPFWFYLLVFLVVAFLIMVFYSKYYSFKKEHISENILKIGSFIFYPEENKLVKEAKDIPLSNKECELLEILISKPNQIVKREELSKRVWEDNGVIVGRSLDTYISKLRKKLKDDTSIKIVNIHGVGYKLEI